MKRFSIDFYYKSASVTTNALKTQQAKKLAHPFLPQVTRNAFDERENCKSKALKSIYFFF